ncbi:ABC-2 type transport system permease protein [Lipingzhangella halophila]|uniref:Transport permease protein n=1 Tax=Lipingzhangella halophila TaxID=1783352 RepID=A0A7W7RJ77_9ACTN|nr:ABC transporter permease [Lipingzhangella halophila]MBB4932426.1 ABC-2 type transport system permease protein [Lipingzhangella halophila]
MTALTPPMGRLRWTFTDGLTLVGRELGRLRQEPGQLVAMLVFPAIMVVLFGYVFGSAIQVPGGGDYREYLMPGLFSMVTFSAVMSVMTRTATDASRGVMDRFKSMPMARSAVPFGTTGADLLGGLLSLAIMVGAGLLVGWQPHSGPVHTAEAFLLLIVLRYALSWVGVYLGMVVKNDEVADQLVPLFLPFTMLSNSFVPTDGMPGWLRVLADWNPVSALTAASRELFGNPGVPSGDVAWPLAHPVAAVLLWSAALLVVFVPLSIRTYKRKGR